MTWDALGPYLLWTKSFHVIAVIAWMSGLLYLPRLFVYHCETVRGSAESERFKVMEGKLYSLITVPAMLVAFVFGILLIMTPGAVDWHAGWWHTKLTFVVLMAAFTGIAGGWRRKFREDRNVKPARYYRIANEIPAVFMIIIVIMAIAQPY